MKDNYNKLFEIAKQFSNTVLNKKSDGIKDDLLSEKEKSEILDNLTDPEKKQKRLLLIKKINLSKRKDWNEINAIINRGKLRIGMITFSRVAAIFIVVLGLTCFHFYEDLNNQNATELTTTNDDIIIQLDNGETKIIGDKGDVEIINSEGEVVGVQKGNTLNYVNKNDNKTKNNISQNLAKISEVLAFNEITVPYGKTFQIVLSDGTKVHLNAGSSLKYPIKFLKGNNREIFLKGEAFCEVSEDKNHPFIVNSNNLNIRVLGTKFNVSSYPEDNQINTVLISGSVSLYNFMKPYDKDSSSLLLPGHLGAWDKENESITFKEVDTDMYTGWVEGKLIFRKTPFKIIRKKLERHYNVTIINNNLLLDNKLYNAVFETETIEDVLMSFQKNYAIEYQIVDNKIIID